MNLVLAGAVDEALRNRAIELTRPVQAVRLPSGSWRLEGAHDGPKERQTIASLCESARIDHAYVDAGTRFADMKLLAMDMDSTLITIECIDEIASRVGKRNEVAAITELAMRGDIPDFAESLRRRVALLAGADVGILGQVFEQQVRLSEGAEELILTAHSNGLETLLLSGGFTYFTERLKKTLHISGAFANHLCIRNGALTGEVAEPIFDAIAKAEKVKEVANRLNCISSEVIVIGDGANDIPMMQFAGHAIAYRAKPAAQAAARYVINHTSLKTAIDFLT